MLTNKLFKIAFFSLICFAAQAQNGAFDWGIGVNGSLYSYSALEENKMSSPYQYNRGTQITVSKYINNNFDVEFQAGMTTTRFFTGMLDQEYTYASTRLYDGSFNLKYKLDNGYIIKKENFTFSPFIKVGVGSNYVDYRESMDVSIPAGAGFSVVMGNRLSFVMESSYRYNIIASNAYMTHGIGLKYNFMKASRKRLAAQNQRNRERKLARIEKYRSKHGRSQKETLASVLKEDKQDEVANSLIEEKPATPVEPTPVSEPVVVPTNSLADEAETVVEVEEETFSSSRALEVKSKEYDKPIEVASSSLPVVEKETKVVASPTPSSAPIKEADKFCVSNSANVMTEIGREITFDVNSTRIRTKMHKSLKEVISIMNKCESQSFVILAHTDKDGDADYNTKLAQDRAEAVKEYLVKYGNINADRLVTLAIGEYGASSGDKDADRRISFKVNKTSK